MHDDPRSPPYRPPALDRADHHTHPPPGGGSAAVSRGVVVTHAPMMAQKPAIGPQPSTAESRNPSAAAVAKQISGTPMNVNSAYLPRAVGVCGPDGVRRDDDDVCV